MYGSDLESQTTELPKFKPSELFTFSVPNLLTYKTEIEVPSSQSGNEKLIHVKHLKQC